MKKKAWLYLGVGIITTPIIWVLGGLLPTAYQQTMNITMNPGFAAFIQIAFSVCWVLLLIWGAVEELRKP